MHSLLANIFTMDGFFNALQFIGGIILTFGYIPQIIKVCKTRSTKDFHLGYFYAIWTGIAFMEAFAIYNGLRGIAVMFLITNTIALSCESVLLGLILWFRADNKRKGLNL